MTFVKICGLTRAEDARAAIEAGAHAIGFVFWPDSPRYISAECARNIVEELALPVIAIGVFVNQPAIEINHIAAMVGLDAVQLHGDETAAFASAIDRPVIKAVGSRGQIDATAQWPKEVTLLVDAHDAVRRGGTGKHADWARAAGLARHRRVVLAGGLNPENVAQAIADVRPYGIDVSSGVESAPGVKDPRKLSALFEALEAVNR